MIVYVLMLDVDWANYVVEGVFTTRELAESKTTVSVWRGKPERRSGLDQSGSIWVIERHEVQS